MEENFKFKERYNPNSNRLENYDYSSNWWYFITICTKDREEYFWEIVDWKMILNEYGKIVFDEISNVKNIDEFVIMPNHIHFILLIEQKNVETSIYGVLDSEIQNKDEHYWDAINGHLYGVSENWEKLYRKWWITGEKNIMVNKESIWFIIRKLKWKITFVINKLNKEFFAWQSNYYDRIIRDQDELYRIRKYILENPLKWELDKDNPENIFM